MVNPLKLKEKIEIGDYVQNLRVPEACGIVIKMSTDGRLATVDWDIPGLSGEDTITTTSMTSLRLISKPKKC
tara:strand:- start:218 stop:433 length:216 start_codon:yes stop_codon:yes gene_type:complete